MIRRVALGLALALAGVGCASAKPKPPEPTIRQAEHGLPAATEFAEGPDRAAYAAAHAHEAKGDAAGGAEPSRAEWAQAAAGYAAVADRPAAAEWRIPLRHRAAELFLRAQRWDEAARSTEALVGDAGASGASKAVASRLAASAALGAAGAAVRAGQLEKLDLAVAHLPSTPRPPAPAWKRVVETTDAYLARSAADPEAARHAPERRNGLSAQELALAAAEVQLAHGELEDARRRLDSAIERWPADGEVLEQAAPLVLATFLAKGDRVGHDAALERLRARAEQAAKTAAGKDREAFLRVQDALGRARAGSRFAEAERLAANGMNAEAAKAFEALAAEPGMTEPANALHNAAVAWDKAGDGARAAAVRERIVREHAASKVAPEDALALADHLARAGEALAAARAYDDYLARWPDAAERCVALQNVANELERGGRPAEAAARYLAFGTDAGCARAKPDVAARALVVAGRLFEGQAKTAYGAATAVDGVADAETKKMVSEARRRMRGP